MCIYIYVYIYIHCKEPHKILHIGNTVNTGNIKSWYCLFVTVNLLYCF